MASEFRNVSLSVYYRAWQVALQQGYYTDITNYRLVKVADKLYGMQKDRSLVFMDNDMNPWPSGVVLKQNGVVIPSGQYKVNYLKGQFQFTNSVSGDIDADLRVSTIRVVPYQPADDELTRSELPVVATDNRDSMGRPFAIGTAELFRNRNAEVSILARNNGELEDLMDMFERYMAHINLANFSVREPLRPDGTLDLGYRFDDVVIRRLNQRVKPYAKKVLYDPRRSSDKERYKATVTLETETVS